MVPQRLCPPATDNWQARLPCLLIVTLWGPGCKITPAQLQPPSPYDLSRPPGRIKNFQSSLTLGGSNHHMVEIIGENDSNPSKFAKYSSSLWGPLLCKCLGMHFLRGYSFWLLVCDTFLFLIWFCCFTWNIWRRGKCIGKLKQFNKLLHQLRLSFAGESTFF